MTISSYSTTADSPNMQFWTPRDILFLLHTKITSRYIAFIKLTLPSGQWQKFSASAIKLSWCTHHVMKYVMRLIKRVGRKHRIQNIVNVYWGFVFYFTTCNTIDTKYELGCMPYYWCIQTICTMLLRLLRMLLGCALVEITGHRFNIKTVIPGIGSFHYKDKTVVKPSYLYSESCFTSETASLYSDGPTLQW